MSREACAGRGRVKRKGTGSVGMPGLSSRSSPWRISAQFILLPGYFEVLYLALNIGLSFPCNPRGVVDRRRGKSGIGPEFEVWHRSCGGMRRWRSCRLPQGRFLRRRTMMPGVLIPEELGGCTNWSLDSETNWESDSSEVLSFTEMVPGDSN